MRHYVVVFFAIALVAALLGLGDVRKVSGVGRVMNELHMVSNAKQADAKAADDEVERELKKVLESRADFSGVVIEVTNCIARLTGTVASHRQRREAMQVAIERLETMQVVRTMQAACFVQDDLRLAR